MRLIGIDPGLRFTGWGVIESSGARLCPVAAGAIKTDSADDLASRLAVLYHGLQAIFADYHPEEAAVEITFQNPSPTSSLKLGHARAIALLVPALQPIPIYEYAPNTVKKALVGAGHAEKAQLAMMVARLLPGLGAVIGDAADALAIAICHAHSRTSPLFTTARSSRLKSIDPVVSV